MAGIRINIIELTQITRLIKKRTSNRKVADILKISRNTVKAFVRIFEAHNLDYSDLNEFDDAVLMALFPCSSEDRTSHL